MLTLLIATLRAQVTENEFPVELRDGLWNFWGLLDSMPLWLILTIFYLVWQGVLLVAGQVLNFVTWIWDVTFSKESRARESWTRSHTFWVLGQVVALVLFILTRVAS